MLGLPVNENLKKEETKLDGHHQPQNLLIKEMNKSLDRLDTRYHLPKKVVLIFFKCAKL